MSEPSADSERGSIGFFGRLFQAVRGINWTALHTRILLGLILGAVCGLAANAWMPTDTRDWLNRNVMGPVGAVFLRMLLMTVIPLVFCSLAVGVAKLGDLRQLGRMGGRTMLYFVVTMTMAVAIGLALVNTVQPGASITTEERKLLLEEGNESQQAKSLKTQGDQKTTFGVHTFVEIVPDNPLKAAVNMNMLAVIFFALLFGIGITRIEPHRGRQIEQFLESVGEIMVFIIHLAMLIAPFGVFAFLFEKTSVLGMRILAVLGLYVLVVVVGLAIQMFIVLPILLRTLARVSPVEFFRRTWTIMVTAFSTSSSNATLPTTIRVTQENLKVPPQVAGFVLPLGATMNMNGTALFEGVTVVFLAQVYGVPLDFGQQIVIIVLSVLTAIGAAGVPGGSLPLLMMILAYANVPPEAIGIVLGVDRLLDMCRTTLNVIGDVTAAAYVARAEGFPLMDEAPPPTPERTVDGNREIPESLHPPD